MEKVHLYKSNADKQCDIGGFQLEWWKIYLKKNPLHDLLSSLNAVISTNESTRIITGHGIYNPAYAYKFQLKTTIFVRPHNPVWHGGWGLISSPTYL